MVTKLDLPFRFSGGRAVTTPQDGQREVDNCVEAVLRTTVGTRIELPTFGIPDMTFRTNGPDPLPLREAIDTWEPRAKFVAEADGSDLADRLGRVKVTMEPATAG
jgi:phage baseplate assembly protein W